MKKFSIKTVNQLRASFWASFPEFKSDYRKTYRQNDYCADIRTAWVNYTDSMQKDGQISQALCDRAIL